jgi:hypothetical protein
MIDYHQTSRECADAFCPELVLTWHLDHTEGARPQESVAPGLDVFPASRKGVVKPRSGGFDGVAKYQSNLNDYEPDHEGQDSTSQAFVAGIGGRHGTCQPGL